MSDEVSTAPDGAAAQKARPTYRVAVVVAPADSPDASVAVNCVPVDPASPEPDDVADALTRAHLSAADVRSRTLLVVDPPPGEDGSAVAAAMMVALWGLSRHRCNVAVPSAGVTVPAVEVDAAYRTLPDEGRPAVRPDLVTASTGDGPSVPGCPHVQLGADLSGEQVTLLRFARRVLLAPSGDTGLDVLSVLAIAAIRARGDQDRLPALWLDSANVGDDPEVLLPGRIVDLGMVRRAAEGVRAATRSDDRGAVAAPEPLTDRQVFLSAVAGTDLVSVLARLGVAAAEVADPDTGVVETVWHCPHPQRHTHGDATPSARLEVGEDGTVGFRCMRCLPERVDALGLVMWATGATVDDAARWLSTGAAATPNLTV